MKNWDRLPKERPVQPSDITFLNFFFHILGLVGQLQLSGKFKIGKTHQIWFSLMGKVSNCWQIVV